MRLNKFFLSALVALGLMACNKEENGVNELEGKSDVVISIGSGMNSRAFTPDNAYQLEEDIQKLDIYFTNSAGVIQYVQSLAAPHDGTTDEVWTALTSGQQVRFCGMENVNRVYVIANDAMEPMDVDQKVAERVAELEQYGASAAEGAIAYVGADVDLGSLEVDNGESMPTVGEPVEEFKLVAAELAIRPVVSRFEINKLGFQSSGSKDIEIDGKLYTVTWSGYDLDVVGVYMSNIYGQLTPITPAVAEGFATPAKASSIAEGKWTDVALGAASGASSVLYYSNYETVYQPLFAEPYTTSGEITYFFDGTPVADEEQTCIPFNFFVPFDVTSTAAANVITAHESFGMTPAIHIQFKKKETATFTVNVVEKDGGAEASAEVKAKVMLQIGYPNTADGIAYANIVSYNGTEGVATMRPGNIYRMADVVVTPFNLTATPDAEEQAYNVIVKVTIIPFAEVNVTPEFDKN